MEKQMKPKNPKKVKKLKISRSGRLLGIFFGICIAVLKKTVRVHINGAEHLAKEKIAGYWHGDSCSAVLMLQKIQKREIPVCAVVTADWRGDSIEKLLGRAGAHALRMKNGYAVKENIRALYDRAGDCESLLVAAMDGPAGPQFKPKRLLFKAAEQSGRDIIQITFRYSAAIKLRNRWDDYAIPLPFSRMDVDIINIGPINRDELRNFESTREKLVV